MHARLTRLFQSAHALARAAGRAYVRGDDISLAAYMITAISLLPLSSWITSVSSSRLPSSSSNSL